MMTKVKKHAVRLKYKKWVFIKLFWRIVWAALMWCVMSSPSPITIWQAATSGSDSLRVCGPGFGNPSVIRVAGNQRWGRGGISSESSRSELTHMRPLPSEISSKLWLFWDKQHLLPYQSSSLIYKNFLELDLSKTSRVGLDIVRHIGLFQIL